MNFKIDGKEYELAFGMKFIREMDRRYTIKKGGLEFGMGMNLGVSYLRQQNPTVLQNILESALSHEKNRPSAEKIEKELEKLAVENDGLEKVFKDFETELGNAPLTKSTMKQFAKNEKAAQKAAKEE